MRVLDIGCGWGEALKFAAERYGVSGVGVTISREQAEFARELCAGLPIDIRVQDYRELTASALTAGVGRRFDRVFSLGMFEHVGVKNYRKYFEVARACLPDDGLFLLHTIGNNVSRITPIRGSRATSSPTRCCHRRRRLRVAVEGLFVIEDWHGFGTDYDLTLQAWRDNVEAAWDRCQATTNASAGCGGSISPPRWRVSVRGGSSSGKYCCRRTACAAAALNSADSKHSEISRCSREVRQGA